MTRPVIALMGDSATMNWAIWRDVRVTHLAWSYIAKVTDAGGAPMLLPPVPEAAADVLARADGLILTGGADLEPARYGAPRDPHTFPPDEARDTTDLAALAVAEQRGIPVLAICRGMQILAISRGGTLHQHLPEHAPTKPGRYNREVIDIKPDSRLGAALGRTTTVLCHHHQALDVIGDDLVATAWADDGVIEAVEDPQHPFMVGIQAHPEEGDNTAALFGAFVAATRR
jgi:putative glutamine amidotransferase